MFLAVVDMSGAAGSVLRIAAAAVAARKEDFVRPLLYSLSG